MLHEIKILCPGHKCGKCRRMISRVEEAAILSKTKVNIVIIDKLEEILKYQTWILPTLIINEKIVAKGYVPGIKMIQKYFKQPKHILS
jgi:hypothetical protein